MNLEHLNLQLKKRARRGAFSYCVSAPVSDESILEAARRLRVSFPIQVKCFYKQYNGFRVDNPPLEVLPIDELTRESDTRVRFATLDNCRSLFFDVAGLNEAGQWDVIAENGFRITLTMASFWSNKIWAWIDKRRTIWERQAFEDNH